jgi:hypothetical protein
MQVSHVGSPLRERIWVPGVAWVSDERELQVGPHVGFNGYGDAFTAAPLAAFGSIVEWRHTAWLVERKSLTSRLVDDHAIILAEALIDPDEMPNARRWLREQPLVCVSGLKVKRLMAAGLRVFRVEHGVEKDDWLVVEGAGADRPGWRLRGRIGDLMPAELAKGGSTLARAASPGYRTFVDRILEELSRGALREASVNNALTIRKLVEPGYGYRGATDGQAARIEDVERALRPLEAVFGQIYARAASERKSAREMERAVSRAAPDVDEIEIPIYGRALRQRLEEVALPMAVDGEPSYLAAERPMPELVLPPRSSFVVERVALWSPEPPEGSETPPSRGSVARPWMAIALTLVLMAIVAAGLWLRP